jgi:hypothetical protein
MVTFIDNTVFVVFLSHSRQILDMQRSICCDVTPYSPVHQQVGNEYSILLRNRMLLVTWLAEPSTLKMDMWIKRHLASCLNILLLSPRKTHYAQVKSTGNGWLVKAYLMPSLQRLPHTTGQHQTRTEPWQTVRSPNRVSDINQLISMQRHLVGETGTVVRDVTCCTSGSQHCHL